MSDYDVVVNVISGMEGFFRILDSHYLFPGISYLTVLLSLLVISVLVPLLFKMFGFSMDLDE